MLDMIRRFARAGERHGVIKIERSDKDKRNMLISLAEPGKKWDDKFFRDAVGDDKRLLPRLHGVPVDVEKELFGIFERHGKPMQMEEIISAWIFLRPNPKRKSITADMLKIMAAKEKRERKAAKAAAVARRTQESAHA